MTDKLIGILILATAFHAYFWVLMSVNGYKLSKSTQLWVKIVCSEVGPLWITLGIFYLIKPA